MQPVYVKDDFFDSLSCDALDGGLRNGRARTRFSEQVRRDTEVLYSISHIHVTGLVRSQKVTLLLANFCSMIL